MLRATIATRRVRLEGCDEMHHADKFSMFASDEGDADFHMTVSFAKQIELPHGKLIGRHKACEWIETESGELWLYNRTGEFALSYNTTFSQNTLFLQSGVEKNAILHYLYVAQCFSYHLLSYGDGTLHASGIKYGDSGIALCGQSGTGKSTLSRFWTAADPAVRILCEDCPAVTMGDEILLHGTPFCGDDNGSCNDTAPLRAIVVLKKGTANRVVEPPPVQKLFAMLEVFNRPAYCRPLSESAVDTVQALVRRVPVYSFEHDATPAAFAVLQAALRAEGLI